jgi:hypothetical protein
MNQGLLTTLACDVHSWCQQHREQQQQGRHRFHDDDDDGLSYSTKQYYAGAAGHYVY